MFKKGIILSKTFVFIFFSKSEKKLYISIRTENAWKVKRKTLIIRKCLYKIIIIDVIQFSLSFFFFLQNTAKESIIETPTIMLQRPILFTENQIIEVRKFKIFFFKDFSFKICVHTQNKYIFRQTLTGKTKKKIYTFYKRVKKLNGGCIILPTL